MADRRTVVAVQLKAEVGKYISQMDAASAATAGVGKQAQLSAVKGQKANQSLTQSTTNLGQKLGLLTPQMAGVGIAAGAMALTAVKRFAEFDAAMSNVKAVTGETTANMGKLRDAAMLAGQQTKYSAKEAADAITNLAKAGISTADILNGGLKGAMDLAAAGGMEVADAAETAAQAMSMFKLRGEDVPHVADLLAAAAGKASGDVNDMGYALKMGGLVADQFGIDIEETVGTLAAFADAGLQGSDAGTSFKTMLLHLANPSVAAQNTMDELGISAYNAKGEFVGLADLADQLKTKMSGLDQATRDQALALIFGTDAIRGANILYQEGARGIKEWTAAVDDAGYASETAATMTDNLKGDIERLTSSLDNLFVKAGDGANGPLRELVKGLTWVSDGVAWLKDDSWLNKPLVPNIDFGKAEISVDAAALAAGRLDDSLLHITRSTGPAADAARDLASQQQAQAAAAEDAADAQKSLNDEYFKSIDAASRASGAAINFEEAIDNVAASAKKNGHSLDINTEKGRANARAMDDMRSAAVDVIQSMIDQGASQDKVSAKAEKMANRMYAAALAATGSEKAAKELADSLRDVPGEVNTEYKTKGLTSETGDVKALKGAQIDAGKPVTTEYNASGLAKQKADVATLMGTLRKLNGMKIQWGMSGGVGGAEVFSGAVPGGGSAVARAMHQTHNIPNTCGATVGHWLGGKGPHGGTAISAWDNAPAKYKHPGDWHPPAGVPVYWRGGRAGHVALSLGGGRIRSTDWPSRGVTSTTTIESLTRSWGKHYEGWARPFATGGLVDGPGTATSDSIPARLSVGEYVVKASAVDAVGEDFLDAVNAQGYAKGGKAGKKKAAKAKAAKANKLQALLDEIEYLTSMDQLDLAGQIAQLRGAQALTTVGSSEWKDIEVRIHNIAKDMDEASASAAKSAQEVADAEAQAAAEKVAAAEEAARLAAEAAEAERVAAFEAAKERRDSYASGVASGVIGQLQMGQDNNGKKWGVGSLLGDFNKRANSASEFASAVQGLTSRGLSREVVQQVVAAGPVSGMGMIRALQAMDDNQLASVNASQNAIASSAANLGGFLGNAFMSVAGDSTLKIDVGGSNPIVLQLDSRTVYQGLLELQRMSGGSLEFVSRR